MRHGRTIAAGSLCFALMVLGAEPKKPEPPTITTIAPLGIAPGIKTRLTVRGLRLDTATAVRCQEPKATVKLLKKSKVGAPNPQSLQLIGDTQVEAEVILPPDYPKRTVTVTVVTPSGESPARALLIERAPIVEEKEPNNGFRQAQRIALPSEVGGRIEASKDVDLYRFEGKAGQKITVEINAARLGSTLDALVTLYDGEGRILASHDDAATHSDPILDAKLPTDGVYYVGVIDANDEGGPTYLYRLSLRLHAP